MPDLTSEQLRELGPLAAVIARTIQETPIRLTGPDPAADLVVALTVRVAAYVGGILPPPDPGLWRRVAATTARTAQTADPADYDLAPPPEESGDDHRRRIARAQIVADHWRQALFQENPQASHALAMVASALNGATNPSDCGLPEHLHHAYRTADTTGGRT